MSAQLLWLWEKPMEMLQGTPTDCPIICLPGQDAAASACIPHADVASTGATEQQGHSPEAQRGQCGCFHPLGQGFSVCLWT